MSDEIIKDTAWESAAERLASDGDSYQIVSEKSDYTLEKKASDAAVSYGLVRDSQQAEQAEDIVYDALVDYGITEDLLAQMTFTEALEQLAVIAKVSAKTKKRQRPDDEVGSVYFHIDNGGVSFSVLDTGYGPAVQVSASHFGHPTAQTKVMIDRDGVKALAELFTQAAAHEFKDAPYVCTAKLSAINGQRVNRDGSAWEQTESSCCTVAYQKTAAKDQSED